MRRGLKLGCGCALIAWTFASCAERNQSNEDGAAAGADAGGASGASPERGGASGTGRGGSRSGGAAGAAAGGRAEGGSGGGAPDAGEGAAGGAADGGTAGNGAASGTGNGGAAGSGAAGNGGAAGGPTGGSAGTGSDPVFAELDLGENHSCGRLTNGTVYCWGENTDGRLGDGTALDQSRPVRVRDLTGVVAISAGAGRTCAVMGDATVWCWRDNPTGSLGGGIVGPFAVPTPVPGLANVIGVSLGSSHSCALLANQTVRCWGSNATGQLGNESAGSSSETPVEVTGLTRVVEVRAGALHTCARRDDGSVRCWGDNFWSQLAKPPSASNAVPALVEGLPLAYSLATGSSHTCAVIEEPAQFPPYGNVMCWGDNRARQLGSLFTTIFGEPNAHPVAALLAAGHQHNCVLTTGDLFSCWGDNRNGQLGLGYTGDPTAGLVQGLASSPPIVQITLGTWHTCVLHRDGSAHCWGLNDHGQLGIGNRLPSPSPAWVQLIP